MSIQTTTSPLSDPQLRDRILSDPATLLDDHEIREALLGVSDRARGGNVVDLRTAAMERLETRLDLLEVTHQSVIAAAYENIAGMAMIHRATLDLIEPTDFSGFLAALRGPVADVLRVDTIRLVLETGSDGHPVPSASGDVLALAEQGYCSLYVEPDRSGAPRKVTLRRIEGGAGAIFGARAPEIRSEACLLLESGATDLPGMLVMGATDPEQFAAGQGTDLLSFFAGVVERALQRVLG